MPSCVILTEPWESFEMRGHRVQIPGNNTSFSMVSASGSHSGLGVIHNHGMPLCSRVRTFSSALPHLSWYERSGMHFSPASLDLVPSPQNTGTVVLARLARASPHHEGHPPAGTHSYSAYAGLATSLTSQAIHSARLKRLQFADQNAFTTTPSTWMRIVAN